MHPENILEDLYHGNINPNDKCFDRDSEYAKCLGVIADNEKKLIAFLNELPTAEEERRLFSQLMDAQLEISSFGEVERFIEGFQLGARFMMDIFILPQKSVIRDVC